MFITRVKMLIDMLILNAEYPIWYMKPTQYYSGSCSLYTYTSHISWKSFLSMHFASKQARKSFTRFELQYIPSLILTGFRQLFISPGSCIYLLYNICSCEVYYSYIGIIETTTDSKVDALTTIYKFYIHRIIEGLCTNRSVENFF